MDAKGYNVDVKGYMMDTKGYKVDVKSAARVILNYGKHHEFDAVSRVTVIEKRHQSLTPGLTKGIADNDL
eukprot:8826792-Pyramimonas_sp.AAC.2